MVVADFLGYDFAMSLSFPPLLFSEGHMTRPWGGQRLASLYGKSFAANGPIGEVWLVADHERWSSRVVSGPLAGRTLEELVREHPAELLGKVPRLTAAGRFPLLLKLIDVADWLSIQVHPSDADAERLGEIDGGKTEMWYVLAAEHYAEILCGASALGPQLPQGRDWLECIDRFGPTGGDSYFVPPGTVHAIGPGLVIAEIQQTSDITYRLFDWDRDALAQRPLHLDKAAEVVRGEPSRGPINPVRLDENRELLCACEKFAVERVRVSGTWKRDSRADSFHILLNIGTEELQVQAGGEQVAVRPGSAALVPGVNRGFSIAGRGAVLDYYVPNLGLDVVGPLAGRGVSAQEIEALGCGYAEHRP